MKDGNDGSWCYNNSTTNLILIYNIFKNKFIGYSFAIDFSEL